ncbi:MAG: peptidoglycan-binding protein [Saprospiraceae bacterium]|nr:peptidoglycan-binding protein [Saprospiraceae bacterium]
MKKAFLLFSLLILTSGVFAQTKAEIKQAQEILASLGYEPGLADGTWGKRTQEALNKFRKDNSLAASGKLDKTSLEALKKQQEVKLMPNSIYVKLERELELSIKKLRPGSSYFIHPELLNGLPSQVSNIVVQRKMENGIIKQELYVLPPWEDKGYIPAQMHPGASIEVSLYGYKEQRLPGIRVFGRGSVELTELPQIHNTSQDKWHLLVPPYISEIQVLIEIGEQRLSPVNFKIPQ